MGSHSSFTQGVIPAKGVAGVSYSMLYACGTGGLCRSQCALQGKIQARLMYSLAAVKGKSINFLGVLIDISLDG